MNEEGPSLLDVGLDGRAPGLGILVPSHLSHFCTKVGDVDLVSFVFLMKAHFLVSLGGFCYFTELHLVLVGLFLGQDMKFCLLMCNETHRCESAPFSHLTEFESRCN